MAIGNTPLGGQLALLQALRTLLDGEHNSEERKIMGDKGKDNKDKPEEKKGKREAWQTENARSNEVSVPAIRHIGPTLESDPEYLELVGSGGPTPEAQIAEEAAKAEPDVRELAEVGIDPITGHEVEAGKPEPLKTRLPGDTSSDPHTDVGPDNATTVQKRGERERKAA